MKLLIIVLGLSLVACENKMAGGDSAAHASQSHTSTLTPLSTSAPRSKLELRELRRENFGDCFPGNGRGLLRQVTYEYKRIYSAREGREIVLKAHVTQNSIAVSGGRYPAVAMFHGGGWKSGAPTFWFSPAFYLASRGVVTVSFEYRLGTDVKESVADARSAMRWLRKFSVELGIDSRKIMATGDSAGGHLALSTSLVDSISDEDASNANFSSDANAIFAAYPVTDGSLYNLDAAISPLALLSRANLLPSTKIVHGTADSLYLTPYSGSQNFCARANLLAGDNRCALTAFAGFDHAFLGDPRAYAPAVALLDSFLMDLGWLTGDYSQLQTWVTSSAPHCNQIVASSIDGWSAPYGYSLYSR